MPNTSWTVILRGLPRVTLLFGDIRGRQGLPFSFGNATRLNDAPVWLLFKRMRAPTGPKTKNNHPWLLGGYFSIFHQFQKSAKSLKRWRTRQDSNL